MAENPSKVKANVPFGLLHRWELVRHVIERQTESDDGSPWDVVVMFNLLSHRNFQTGQCNPRHKTIAKEIGTSVSTVRRSLKRLEEYGALEIKPIFRDGEQSSNQYNIKEVVEWLTTAPAESSATPDVAQDSKDVAQDNMDYSQEDRAMLAADHPPGSPVDRRRPADGHPFPSPATNEPSEGNALKEPGAGNPEKERERLPNASRAEILPFGDLLAELQSNHPEPNEMQEFRPGQDHEKAERFALRKALRKASQDTVLSGHRRFVEFIDQNPDKFVPGLATWLNHERWEDEIDDQPAATSRHAQNDNHPKPVRKKAVGDWPPF
jgi:hypothetical protein